MTVNERCIDGRSGHIDLQRYPPGRHRISELFGHDFELDRICWRNCTDLEEKSPSQVQEQPNSYCQPDDHRRLSDKSGGAIDVIDHDLEVTLCLYCQIADSSAPAAVIYEDSDVIGIAAPRPLHAGHCVVIPRVHAESIAGLDPRVATHLWLVALMIERAIERAGLREEGISLILGEGALKSRDEEHVQLHLVPRQVGDAWSVLELERSLVEQRMLDRVARVLRENLS